MKKSHQCPKCDGLRIGYLESVLDWGPPFYTPGVRHSRADVEAFVCGECGYFETFLKDPAAGLEGTEGFRWLGSDGDSPYR